MPPKKKTKTGDDGATTSRSTRATKGQGRKAAPTKRSAGGNVRGRRGGLQDMPNMPLDVLFEIFGYLHPRDLLSLARTTRDFRAFLMSRKAASFWQKSRKLIEDLPEIPEGLSEPAYANLMFSNHCHSCLRNGPLVTPFWTFFARYCTRCRDELPYECGATIKKILLDYPDLSPANIISYVYVSARHSTKYNRLELDEVKRAWEALTNDVEKRKFLEDRQAYKGKCQEFGRQAASWLAKAKASAAADTAQLKHARFQAVISRLRQEGWGEELDLMSSDSLNHISTMEAVSRPTALTERGWQSMRATVVGYVQDVKASRLAKDRFKILEGRLAYLKSYLYRHQHEKLLSSDSELTTCPGLAECVKMPEIRAIIQDTSNTVTQEYMATEFARLLPDVFTRWVEDRRAALVKLTREVLADTPAANVDDPLELAIASFTCWMCHKVGHRWPTILDHHCFRVETHDADDDKLLRRALYACIGTRRSNDLPYVGDKYAKVDSWLPLVRDVITACGRDPDTVTYVQMEGCDVRLRCRLCAKLSEQEIFDWKAAICHDRSHLSNADETPFAGRWEPISEAHTARVRELEGALAADTSANSKHHLEEFRCTWCGEVWHHLISLKHHLLVHNKKNPKEGDDYIYKRTFKAADNIKMYADFLESAPGRFAHKSAIEAGTAFYASF